MEARVRVLGIPVNLNHTGHYLHWGVVQISMANGAVVVLMLVVFALALLVPMPHRKRRR